MIKINNLSYSYLDDLILKDITCNFKKDQITTIVGPSGCGKTTLIKLILEEQQQKIAINHRSKDHIIGYMPQQDLLLNWYNVESNLKLSGLITGKYQLLDPQISKEFDLEKLLHASIDSLSGGQKSKISFLRAFLSCDDILICDEPFSKLDYITRFKTHNWFLKTLQKYPKTVIFVTHDIEEALTLSDTIIVLSKSPATIIKTYQKPFSANLKETIINDLV